MAAMEQTIDEAPAQRGRSLAPNALRIASPQIDELPNLMVQTVDTRQPAVNEQIGVRVVRVSAW